MSREKFEKIVSSPPFELCTERWPNDPAKYAWPGNYKHYNLQLAYDVCMDYSKEQAEQLTIAKQRIAELEKDADILQTNLDAALAQAKQFKSLIADIASTGFLTPGFESSVTHRDICKQYKALKVAAE